jgi:hypothetical protein
MIASSGVDWAAVLVGRRIGGWRKTRNAGLETGGRDKKAPMCRERHGNSAPLPIKNHCEPSKLQGQQLTYLYI